MLFSKTGTGRQLLCRRQRAYSIIQLLISLVITGVVLGGAFVLFGKWKSNLSVAQRQEKLREVASIGMSELKKDINAALRDNFDARFVTFRGINSPSPVLTQFYVQAHEGSFAARLVEGDNFITIDSRYEDDNAAVAGFTQLIDFLRTDGQLVANIDGRQVLIRRDYTANGADVQLVHSGGDLTGIKLVADSSQQQQGSVSMSGVFDAILAGRDEVFFRVSPVRIVTWLNSGGALVRRYGGGSDVVTKRFPNFRRVSYQYEFGVYDDWAPKSLPSGPLPTTSPDYTGVDGADCGDLPPDPSVCVNGNDITSVLVEAVFTGKPESTYPSGNWQPVEGSSLLRDEDQDDYAMVITERVKPSGYFKGSEVSASLVDPTCQVLDPFRCDPAGTCDAAFVSTDRNSPNWVGYIAGSPYCDCCDDGAGGIRADCESNPQDFGSLADTAVQDKLSSCRQAFGCGYTDRRYSDGRFDPAHFLACECVHPDVGGDALHDYNPDTQVYETNSDLIGSGSSVLEDASDPNLKCEFYNGRSCGDAAQALSPGVFGGADIWEQVCSCRASRVNGGGIEVGNMYGHVADFEELCNAEVDMDMPGGINTLTGQDGTISCSNTIEPIPGAPDANGFYFRYKEYTNTGDPNDQRLDDQQQKECACLKASNAEHGRDTWNLAYQDMTRGGAGVIPNSGGLVAPNAQVVASDPRHGSLQCGNTICSAWGGDDHPGAGCCVAGGYYSGAQLQADLTAAGLGANYDAARDAWAGWCYSGCDRITTSNSLRTYFDNARMALTGVTDVSQIPAFCNGPAGTTGTQMGVQ